MHTLLKIHLTILFFSLFSFSFGQSDTTQKAEKVVVTKHDGAQYVGIILKDDGREILIETESIGKLYLPKHMIKSIKAVSDSKMEEDEEDKSLNQTEEKNTQTKSDSVEVTDAPPVKVDPSEQEEEFKYSNYISTKYLYFDNAMPLRRGESFIKFTLVGFEGQLRITDRWSAGLISSYAGAPAILKTKYSIPLAEQAYLSFSGWYGSMAFGSPFNRSIRDGGGIGIAAFTWGDRKKNFTVQGGYGYVHYHFEAWQWNMETGLQQVISEMRYENIGMAAFSGMVKTSEKTTAVFEGTTIFREGGEFYTVAGAAARFGFNPRAQFQLGGSFLIQSGIPVPIPIINASFTYVFRERNP